MDGIRALVGADTVLPMKRRAIDPPSDAHEDALLKIGKTLGVGTALVQRLVMEQPTPFRRRRR